MGDNRYKQDDKLLMMEHISFGHPKEPIDTQWGEIPYELYLMLERKRILEDPMRVAEIVTRKGKVSLFVNRIAGDPEPGDIWMSRDEALTFGDM